MPGFVWFLAKMMTLVVIYVWLRATLPRLRYDALMALGWKPSLTLEESLRAILDYWRGKA